MVSWAKTFAYTALDSYVPHTACLLQMHTAMMLHFAFVTPHRQVEDVHHQRAMGKKRPAPRAPPASRTTTRYVLHDGNEI